MIYKTTPHEHQALSFGLTKDLPNWAHFWDMGTGKTKMAIDQFVNLWLKGEIDAMLVVAPPTVHENWFSDELPDHMPDQVPWKGYVYYSSKAKTRNAQRQLRQMFREEFPILMISYNAFKTKRGKNDGPEIWVGKDLVKRFLTKRKVLYVLDESQRIKTPSTKITKAVVATGKHSQHKRILSGTSITNSPFDLYTQLKFLDPTFWHKHGFGSLESFKTTFGVFEEVRLVKAGQAKAFRKLKYYKNLKYLGEIIKNISDRVTADEVLDLPERTFTKRYFEPSAEQKKIYKSLKEEFYAMVQGEMITAQLAITQLIRFQQVLSGFVEKDLAVGGGTLPLKENPRLNCLLDLLNNDVEGKAIIWARFRYDIDQITKALGDTCARLDGAVPETGRLHQRKRFQEDPECRFFVANPAAAATGLTLNEARTTIYYTLSFNLEHWLQSLARNYRIGQGGTVNVINIMAQGMGIDTRLVARLREKRKMAAQIMGDELMDWI